ncbi:hypothetical protein LWI28_006630 [Acer negundo]|uniref:Uncharacterized protein n=1 Tax=Acer negundo TaxID=4023 RepID=A0AAD5JSU5_ACENE|nr:hypothetical protein LWI28_006630 [Acer negundo]
MWLGLSKVELSNKKGVGAARSNQGQVERLIGKFMENLKGLPIYQSEQGRVHNFIEASNVQPSFKGKDVLSRKPAMITLGKNKDSYDNEDSWSSSYEDLYDSKGGILGILLRSEESHLGLKGTSDGLGLVQLGDVSEDRHGLDEGDNTNSGLEIPKAFNNIGCEDINEKVIVVSQLDESAQVSNIVLVVERGSHSSNDSSHKVRKKKGRKVLDIAKKHRMTTRKDKRNDHSNPSKKQNKWYGIIVMKDSWNSKVEVAKMLEKGAALGYLKSKRDAAHEGEKGIKSVS